MMDALLNLTAQMAREGIRRLLVLSGDESWTLQQAQALRERLGGDGLWVGPEPVSAPCVAPGALKTLLGREVMHAFFDARRGFDVAAMAALSGTLRAGSWLVLLTPPFADWPTRADEDSLRWSDTPDPIVTPELCSPLLSAVYRRSGGVALAAVGPATFPAGRPASRLASRRWPPAGRAGGNP